MTMLELECWRASSSQVVRWLNVSRLENTTQHNISVWLLARIYNSPSKIPRSRNLDLSTMAWSCPQKSWESQCSVVFGGISIFRTQNFALSVYSTIAVFDCKLCIFWAQNFNFLARVCIFWAWKPVGSDISKCKLLKVMLTNCILLAKDTYSRKTLTQSIRQYHYQSLEHTVTDSTVLVITSITHLVMS